jgi:hypothetical protein
VIALTSQLQILSADTPPVIVSACLSASLRASVGIRILMGIKNMLIRLRMTLHATEYCLPRKVTVTSTGGVGFNCEKRAAPQQASTPTNVRSEGAPETAASRTSTTASSTSSRSCRS